MDYWSQQTLDNCSEHKWSSQGKTLENNVHGK